MGAFRRQVFYRNFCGNTARASDSLICWRQPIKCQRHLLLRVHVGCMPRTLSELSDTVSDGLSTSTAKCTASSVLRFDWVLLSRNMPTKVAHYHLMQHQPAQSSQPSYVFGLLPGDSFRGWKGPGPFYFVSPLSKCAKPNRALLAIY